MQKIMMRHTLAIVAHRSIPRLHTRSDCNLDQGFGALRSQRYGTMIYLAGPEPIFSTQSTPTSQQLQSLNIAGID